MKDTKLRTAGTHMLGVAGALLLCLSLHPYAQAGKNKVAEGTRTVDSGTFVVIVRGQRVAAETFQIVQGETFSSVTSEFKGEVGEKVVQKAELRIAPSGELRRYEWRELTPHKEQIVVEPSEQFLVEQIVPEAPERPINQPFILPSTTMVLDDYFFSHREVLVWRYLAQACGSDLQNCRPGTLQFGALVPRRRLPEIATLENIGLEKVQINGVERELNRLTLKIPEESDWVLYMDKDFKLVRILIATDQTEIVRQ